MKRAVIAALGIAAAGILACHPADTVADRNPTHDTDGDTISDAVELESHNHDLYGFDPNVWNFNASRAFGAVDAGTLQSGINLPDTGVGGEGYVHHLGEGDAKDTDDWGTLSLINLLELVGRNYRNIYGDCNDETPFAFREDLPRPGFGDLSHQFGGDWTSDHTSHQNGLDVDVRYLRLGARAGNEIGLDLRFESAAYDFDSTLELLQCFYNEYKVVTIFYDQVRTGIDPPPGDIVFVHEPSQHFNHFHVRIEDPDGTNNAPPFLTGARRRP